MLYAQLIAPEGTVYEYCYKPDGWSLDQYTLRFDSVNDTIIMGLDCHTLSLINSQVSGGLYSAMEIILCEDGEQVYYLENDSLYLLYDFGLQPGGSYAIRHPVQFDPWPHQDTFYVVTIDSVGVENIGGIDFTVQYFHTENEIHVIYLGNRLIRGIGFDRTTMLPKIDVSIIDGYDVSDLSYFDNTEITFGEEGACTVTSTEEVPVDENKALYFPNPFTEVLRIGSEQSIQSIRIFDTEGQVRLFTNATTIHTGNWEKGLYIVQVTYRNGRVEQAKVVKY